MSERTGGLAEDGPILLTGATGFVAGALWEPLEAAGYAVRGMTRNAEKARARAPLRQWAQADVANLAQLREAMDGCSAAYYLVHGMGDGAADFRKREMENAESFAAVAAAAGLKRIIYLGGVAPAGEGSEHLRSRLEVGDILRAGSVPTIELRASIIVGSGSLSWTIVRDLAARLPIMILPRWLRSRTQPVAIDDVVQALIGALTMPLPRSRWYDIPGPDTVTGRQILEITAYLMGRRPPMILEVPFLTPWLSSHWVHFVSRADWKVARQVVVGLQEDLVAQDDSFWGLIGHSRPLRFSEAARRAVEAESRESPVQGPWGAVEVWLNRVCRRRNDGR